MLRRGSLPRSVLLHCGPVRSAPESCFRSAPESCSNFLYVFKAARNGPLTPPPGRASGPPLSLGPDAQTARRLACNSGVGPRRRQGEGRCWVEVDLVGSRTGTARATWLSCRAGPQRAFRLSVPGAAARMVSEPPPPPSRALRVASDGRKPAALDGGASATLSGQRSSGRPVACP
jgi:hypothetical protein